jgi:hypothetical protein
MKQSHYLVKRGEDVAKGIVQQEEENGDHRRQEKATSKIII